MKADPAVRQHPTFSAPPYHSLPLIASTTAHGAMWSKVRTVAAWGAILGSGT
jgi:hypothetical protein